MHLTANAPSQRWHRLQYVTMSPTAMIVTAALILFVSALLQSTIGFGSALVAMPMLSPLLGIQTAAAMVGLVSVAFSLLVVVIDRRQIDLRQSWRLMLASLAGVPFGLLLLRNVPERAVLFGLGVVLVGYGLFGLTSGRLKLRGGQWMAWPLGFVSGVLGGAYNTNGPPLVVFGTLQQWPPQQFRATLQGVFFITGIAIAAGQASAGFWTPAALQMTAWAAPGVLAAALLGRWLNTRIPHASFLRIVYGMLIALGVALILK